MKNVTLKDFIEKLKEMEAAHGGHLEVRIGMNGGEYIDHMEGRHIEDIEVKDRSWNGEFTQKHIYLGW